MKFRCQHCMFESDGDVPITRCPRCRELVPATVIDIEGYGRVPLIDLNRKHSSTPL